LASSARPEQLHKISKIRVFLKNYDRDATTPLTSKLISIERLQAQRGVTLHAMTFGLRPYASLFYLPRKRRIILIGTCSNANVYP
jgi:hypothetical protein